MIAPASEPEGVAPEFTLLGSVFLPSSAWAPLAGALRDRGADVAVAELDASGDPALLLRDYAEALVHRPGSIAVAHSNAGNFVPALVGGDLVGSAILLDAVIPPDDGGRRRLVPERLAAELGAGGDLLPPWTDWWPREDLLALLPDPAALERLRAATPRIPRGYLAATIGVPAGWTSRVRAAFLRLSEGYAAESAAATRLGWPTGMLDLGHLGMLRSPEAVADELLRLARLISGGT